MRRFMTIATILISIALPFALMAQEATPELNLYSSSKEHLVRPILDAFTQESGIKVNVTTLNGAAMVARLSLEGADSPADAVIVADVANLHKLNDKAVLSGFESDEVEANIPAILRAENNAWIGVAMRSRIVYKRKDDDAAVATYAELAEPKWAGQLLVRSSENPYNQSLLADLIARDGREAALAWAKGIVANMARKPQGGDRDQIRALASGQGRLAIANSYYFAQMLVGKDASDKALAETLQPIFPQDAHVNIRGAGITKASKNKEAAKQLMVFLTQETAQTMFTNINQEYPANPSIAPSETLQRFGFTPKPKTPLSVIGAGNAQALEVFSEAGWQ
jgi:iron(III) transport system substrate-binding protein